MTGRETPDSYCGEIVRRGRYRVVVCKDGIQWILQRQDKLAGARWRALAYCTTRAALLRLWPALKCSPAPELAELPDNIGSPRRG